MTGYKQYQKYFPLLLIAVTVIAGGYLLLQKGIISLPFSNKKSSDIDVGKKSVIDILFTGKEYKLSYVEMNTGVLVNIAKFDKTETWQGDGSIEEDKKSASNRLTLIDRDRRKATAFMLKQLDLSGTDVIKFTVNMKDIPDDIESLAILFANKDATAYYRFPITNIISGINFFSIPKYRFFLNNEKLLDTQKSATGTAAQASGLTWDKIERVQVELIARPGSKAGVDIGWIRGEKDDIFESEWNWDGTEHFFNLDVTKDGKLALIGQNLGKGIATLKKIGSVKDFSYSAKIFSIRTGPIGLFFRGDYRTAYGYYLLVGGVGSNDWSVYKNALVGSSPKVTPLSSGQLSNFEFSKDQPFWLKVTTKGNAITAHFSLDGNNYTKLAELNDNELGSGGVGIAVAGGGAGYFDDFYLTMK